MRHLLVSLEVSVKSSAATTPIFNVDRALEALKAAMKNAEGYITKLQSRAKKDLDKLTALQKGGPAESSISPQMPWVIELRTGFESVIKKAEYAKVDFHNLAATISRDPNLR